MDNNFDNEFFGFEPQKPVTERDSEQPQEQPAQPAIPMTPQEPVQPAQPAIPMTPQEPVQPAQPVIPPAPQEPIRPVQPPVQAPPQNMYQFEPQRPFMQEQTPAQPVQPVQPFRAEEPAFNPIQHTAVYDDNRFVQQPQQPPYQPPQGYYQPQQQPYYQQPPQPPQPPKQKSKVNTALIVIIIVMGVLLLAGMFGLFAFAMNSADSKKSNTSPTSNAFNIPDFTFPNDNFGYDTPSTTAPVHDESNYSDKANKDYEGLALADKPADAETNKNYNAENAFNAVSPSVVSVLCYSGEVKDNANATSQGSGIIITSDGFVVTNSHVVGNSKTAYAIKVVTADGKEYTAGVVGFDSRTDLAVLKLDGAKDLKAASFGNSDQIQLGEDIIIIGNPGGIEYQNSMTKGIVSALNRDASSKNMVKYIQTDAAINPGNSGGPAVNLYGQVIGIASAKIADEKYEGMGFCIPSVQAKKIVDSLMKNGYVEGRVKIGISGNAVTASDVMQYNVPQGIMVATIDKDGPCYNTGMKANDIITAVDGEMVTSFSDVYEILENHKAGDKVMLKYYSQSDKDQHEVEIVLQEDKR